MGFKNLLNITFFAFFSISSTICFAEPPPLPIDVAHLTMYNRNSPTHSPLYDPTLSPTDRIRQEVARSMLRSTTITHSTSDPRANIMANSFGSAYLMNISIGTPPVTIVAFADTGSDLIWTQCEPCQRCFNQTLPLFQPDKSSTYVEFPCNSSVVSACPPTSSSLLSCSQSGNKNKTVCGYDVLYGDGSYSRGSLARETITMDSTSSSRHPVKLHKYIFGCGLENNGFFDGASGIVGLGGGSESLVSQLGSMIEDKFAYCLAEDVDAVSRITFGRSAVATGDGVVTTHLFTTKSSTFYFLALIRFRVGDVDVPVLLNGTTSINPENIVIDSGTTLTILPTQAYSNFESTISKGIKGADRVADPLGSGLSLCYKGNNFTYPTVAAHFLGDAVVKLQKINLFLQMKPHDDVYCLAFVPDDKFFPIYGNVAQKNFLIAFDRRAQTLSFKPTDCTKANTATASAAGVTAT